MKKLVLKKDVVVRINNDEMHQLRGGYADTANICHTILQATCTAAQTCGPNLGCGNASDGCYPSYTETGFNTENCTGVFTVDICGPSQMASECDTCFVRCTV